MMHGETRRWAWAGWLVAVWLGGCADAVPVAEPVCDEARPCAAGSRCVEGFCQPTRPDEGVAADVGVSADGAPRDATGDDVLPGVDMASPDMASPDMASPGLDMASPELDMASPDMASPELDMASPDMASPEPDMASPEPDMASPDPDMAPPMDCGEYGQACCPGDACLRGGCVDEVCVAFGGVYAMHGESGDRECAGNPLAGGGCACPPGFVDQAVADMDGNVDEGSGWLTNIHVCAPPADDPVADFRGAFGEDTLLRDADRCAEGCEPGPSLAGCGCPAGSNPLAYLGVHYRTNPNPDCVSRVTFCSTPAPLTYGGSYRVYRAGTNVVCDEIAPAARCDANPLTAACTCPPRFVPVTMPLMGPHTNADRADWYCRADLTICVGRP